MIDSRDSSQSMLANLFTISALGVGMLTYLYNKIMNKMVDVEDEIRITQDGLHDLNENVNEMYLRMEALPQKESSKGEDDKIVEENKYQAWIGTSNLEDGSLWLCITRSKLNTKRENTEWMEWDGTKDATVVVRDYYFDTFDSEDWKVTNEHGVWTATTYETMIDGWSNFIRVYARITSTESLENKSLDDIKQLFTRIRAEGLMDWRRELTLSS